jgi:TatD DNase family protein
MKGALMQMSDAHCHLNLLGNPRRIIDESIAAGVCIMITSGDRMEDSRRAIEIADGKTVYAVVGIGPVAGSEYMVHELELRKIIEERKSNIVGIGEIGLDEKHAGDWQADVFARQLELAAESELPVVVHSRGTIKKTLRAVIDAKIENAMFHYFDGGEDDAAEAADHGYLISIPPFRTGRRSKVIAKLEIANLVTETDSPVVGKTPMDVAESIRYIAEAKEMQADEVARLCTENLKKLFNI